MSPTFVFYTYSLACAMHDSLPPADRLICAGVYWCAPEPTLKPLSSIVSPGMEGLRVEWWLGEISQRCTRVLCLWWSGPGNYIRGTTRALVFLSLSLSLSVSLSLWDSLSARSHFQCLMRHSQWNARRHLSDLIGPAVKDGNFCAVQLL